MAATRLLPTSSAVAARETNVVNMTEERKLSCSGRRNVKEKDRADHK
jgi:hypothetical protein